MAITQIAQQYPVFNDLDGSPIDAAFIYFGEVNQNPETHPIPVYWDSALTQPAAQPVRTIGGYLSRNGSPSNLYSNGAFSMTIKNKNGVLVVYCPNGNAFSTNADLVQYQPSATGGISQTLQQVLGQIAIRSTFDTDANYNAARFALTSRADHLVRPEGGTTDRLLSVKLGDFVSPLDAGAVGDGLINDKAAIDAVNTAGRVVNLAGKTYAYTGAFTPVAQFVNGKIVDSNRTHDYTTQTSNSAARIAQNRARLNYNGTSSVAVWVPDSLVMAGFRFMGSYKKGAGRVMPSGATNGKVIVSSLTNLAVESSPKANNWYAVFAVCNKTSGAVTYLNMPFFRAGTVSGSTIPLALGGDATGDTITTTTYAGLSTNELVGADVLVIQEGKAFSGRTTTVTANTNGSVTVANIGGIAANDFFLVAPPGYDDYVYLGSWYSDTNPGEPRNMADTGAFVGSRGSAAVGVPTSGAIATATRYPFAGLVSPLATGIAIEIVYTLSTTGTGVAVHYLWHDSSNHMLMQVYDEKLSGTSSTFVHDLPLFSFSAEQAVWLSTDGGLAGTIVARSLQCRGWLEP